MAQPQALAEDLPTRVFAPALLACACLHLVLGYAFIKASSATYDEPLHLASGYSYLGTGRYRLNILDHPPLGEMLAALPLMALSPELDTSRADFRDNAQYPFADHFLYHNRTSAAAMLDAARSWCLLVWTLLMGGAAVAWAGRLAGRAGALCAAALFAVSPAFLSLDALVTTDAAGAAFFFLSFWLLSEAFRPHAKPLPALLLAAAATGLALASKFNTVIVPPLALLLAAAENRRRGLVPWPVFARLALVYAAVVISTLALVYQVWQFPLYWQGLLETFSRLSRGRSTFVWGHYSDGGVWWYFPLALAIKTPLSTLVLAAFGLGSVVARLAAAKPGAAPQPASWLWLCVPPAVYFLSAVSAKVQIGYRHILPVLPFLVVLAGVGAARLLRGGRLAWLAVVLLAGQAVSVARVSPHYLAYFNELVGGPAEGYKFLVDSNVDWGQALPTLAERLRSIGNPPVLLDYFGVADPAAHGIRFIQVLPPIDFPLREGGEDLEGWDRVLFAVSATQRQAVYIKTHTLYRWLDARRPLFDAGYAIWVYDLTHDREGLLRLAQIFMSQGRRKEAASLARRAQRESLPPHASPRSARK